MKQPEMPVAQKTQIVTLVVMLFAFLITLIIVDRQTKVKDAAIREKDRTIESLRQNCCLPCSQTLPMLNCAPSLCEQTDLGLCCVSGK